MKHKNDLHKLIISLNGRNKKAFDELSGDYNFDDFTLTIDQVSFDMSRDSAHMRARISLDNAKFPKDVFSTRSREIAARDFLIRSFDTMAKKVRISVRNINGGRILIDSPSKEILETSALVVNEQFIEVRFIAELLTRKGIVDASLNCKLLVENIPKIISGSLVFKNIDTELLADWIETCEDADAARDQLATRKLVAFIADGSVLKRNLPYKTGLGDLKTVEFVSPEELAVTLELPNKGSIRGMGIPNGITVITGGRFNGKSTLLKTLELGVYNHIPGDGRELIVTVADAVGIKAEPGRSIEKVNISALFGNPGFSVDYKSFSTKNATASESLAANIFEALEVGTSLLLIDEDTVTADCIGRDARMQALIPKEDEPSSSLREILPKLRDNLGISAVIVTSGSGDFFDCADTVIAMKHFQPYTVTAEAHRIAEEHSIKRYVESPDIITLPSNRLPLTLSFIVNTEESPIRQQPRDKMIIRYGNEIIDVPLTQIVSFSQARALSRSLALVHRLNDSSNSLRDVIEKVMKRIDVVGLDTLSSRLTGDLAMFRAHELAAVINRMENLKIK
ncbi:MAG: ABC-ATPase domain-containing protein [Candidatus Latescibacteria bacterium]|nr:ABC-ATPase domain-containing protein [Candidatus Latescibacterota bacterium]